MNAQRLLLTLMLASILTIPSGCSILQQEDQKSGSAFRVEPAIEMAAYPFPLENVRLTEGPFLRAVKVNAEYLMKLEPDRLLHNFRKNAGLEPKGPVYGGWEQDTIAGHSLGHYLTACSLMYAQTGDARFKERVGYIVDELEACQIVRQDGYVAGFPRGLEVFDEIRAGDIRAKGFDLNGIWVPFYNWHKLLNGLIDANLLCGNQEAIVIATRLAHFIEGVFAPLNQHQIQEVLACEHGGINESMANLYAVTGDQRFLDLAKLIYHRDVLDPLAVERDELAGKHANTQIPKIIGAARIHELTSDRKFATISGFFWDTVIENHTYVIGGNSDREYFQDPKTISMNITEQTCESCNTYNMLKLTRHLFGWSGVSRYADYYERALYNHILAQQHPQTGMLCYMMPLRTGSARSYSTPTDSFWCCVGTGMENHSKYGDSIYFHDGANGLFVNLFIPSILNWPEKDLQIQQITRFPYDDRIQLKFSASDPVPLILRVRIPAWAAGELAFAVNGEDVHPGSVQDGYAVFDREWKDGDVLDVELAMSLRLESTPEDSRKVSILYGPLVLAGDLGSDIEGFDGVTSALVADEVLSRIELVDQDSLTFKTDDLVRPHDLELKPLFDLHDRRYAVYWDRFTPDEWQQHQQLEAAEKNRSKEIESRAIDVIHLGDDRSEAAHNLQSKISYLSTYRGVRCRDARSAGFFSFEAKVVPNQKNTLVARYWGGERNRQFDIVVEGTTIATEILDGEFPGQFIERDYPIPPNLTQGTNRVLIRFQPAQDLSAGPVFGCRIESR